MIAIIEDDWGWEEYYRILLKKYELQCFQDGLAAINEIDSERTELIILDVLLTGPTGFAVLNELRSYPEFTKIPVVVVSSVKIAAEALEKYGVVAVFDKGEMLPKDLLAVVEKELKHAK